jgi:thioredoxin reductase
MKNKNFRNVIIIGAGPAGIAAAIQLNRYGIETLVIEKAEIGGLLKNALRIENYPGFPSSISGPDFIKLLKKQLENNNIEVLIDKVLEVKRKGNSFCVNTKSSTFDSEFLIIASGTKPIEFNEIEISDTLKDRIFYEPYRILKLRRKKIVIVGSGDAAFDYGLNLSRFNYVTIFNRSKFIKALPLLYERIKNNEGISYFTEIKIKDIFHNSKGRMKVRTELKGRIHDFEFDYLIFAIGREQNIGFLSSSIINRLEDLTKEDKIHIIGDAKNGIYRQSTIACGDGILAAMKINKKISGVIE